MKQQATNARYQQQAELDLMRDAINANNGELVEFKRNSSQVVQQLREQVSELRAKVLEASAELSQQSRQRKEAEQRTGTAIGGLQQALSSKQMEVDSSRRMLTEQLERLSSEVDSKFQQLETEVGHTKRTLGSSQEQTIMKFGEVDKAMSMFHGNINGARQELTDTREDWKKSQELLGQAISTDAYQWEELGRENKDRMGRVEAQLVGLQQSVYSANNELILLRSDRDEAMMRTPQTRRQSPRMDAVEKVHGSIDTSGVRFDRSESNGVEYSSTAPAGALLASDSRHSSTKFPMQPSSPPANVSPLQLQAPRRSQVSQQVLPQAPGAVSVSPGYPGMAHRMSPTAPPGEAWLGAGSRLPNAPPGVMSPSGLMASTGTLSRSPTPTTPTMAR
eukprot:CAMPEP_0169152718 /NCGR_PEP_ID=MMETSP1015-20121227/51662_1 /TAXON_ID=342587 /ORGANISM="Karlodinium micrum, Strain CCMP2283" /LENGTH=390 /DNA_ID=CAMNT_0009222529 /DNA_START=290 /DNA_END=1459 /DNA_ORIENTATION=-